MRACKHTCVHAYITTYQQNQTYITYISRTVVNTSCMCDMQSHIPSHIPPYTSEHNHKRHKHPLRTCTSTVSKIHEHNKWYTHVTIYTTMHTHRYIHTHMAWHELMYTHHDECVCIQIRAYRSKGKYAHSRKHTHSLVLPSLTSKCIRLHERWMLLHLLHTDVTHVYPHKPTSALSICWSVRM